MNLVVRSDFIILIIISLILLYFLIVISLTRYYEKNFDNPMKERKLFLSINHYYRNFNNKEILDISFEDYKKELENSKSDLGRLADLMPDSEEIDDQLKEFESLLDFYWECKKDLTIYENEILELWQELYELIKKYEADYSVIIHNLHLLVRITRHAKLSQETRESLDDKLLNLLEVQYSKRIRKDFSKGLYFILTWYQFRIETYYKLMGIGTTERELYFLKDIWTVRERDLALLKIENSSIPIGFYYAVKHFYENLPERKDYDYKSFYKTVMVWIEEVLRREKRGKELSEVIINRKKLEKANKRGIYRLGESVLDYGTGYGERPERLIGYFVLVNLIFTFIFYPYDNSVIKLQGFNHGSSIFENIVDVLYFNFTTMISNVYGNISPQNSVAKLVVIIQQIFGFILTGSFVALFLRKIFRD